MAAHHFDRMNESKPQTTRHPRVIDRIAEGIHDHIDLLGENPASRCQSHISRIAVEQPNADSFFQLADLLAERGLADTKHFRRASEMQLVRDTPEISEMSDFDATHDCVPLYINYHD